MKKLDFERGHEMARKLAYPPLADFVDAYYWEKRGDPKPMQAYLAKIDAIKKKHPKK